MVVGTIDDTVVGYGWARLESLHDDSLLLVITDLYTEPEARGVGVGEAMMVVLEAEARLAGAIGLDALALPGDRQTKNFFETFGLTASDRRAPIARTNRGRRLVSAPEARRGRRRRRRRSAPAGAAQRPTGSRHVGGARRRVEAGETLAEAVAASSGRRRASKAPAGR
ncbi:MAG: GNAT family N-acetyltransferase [Acidimicrobiales bacterium]